MKQAKWLMGVLVVGLTLGCGGPVIEEAAPDQPSETGAVTAQDPTPVDSSEGGETGTEADGIHSAACPPDSIGSCSTGYSCDKRCFLSTGNWAGACYQGCCYCAAVF